MPCSRWGRDDKVLVQMFSRSLEKMPPSGLSGKIRGTWVPGELSTKAFLEHFRFNLEMLPTHEEIEGMHPQE